MAQMTDRCDPQLQDQLVSIWNAPPRDQKLPPYVDSEEIAFKHAQSNLFMKFFSDWDQIHQAEDDQEMLPVYFPSVVDLSVDPESELRLIKDLKSWSMMQYFSPSLATLGVYQSRYCSFPAAISYERRVLLHRHVTWIFLMDEVSEQLPNYKLHSSAGNIYLNNLKNIMRGKPVEDMNQFKGSCPDELIKMAINVQRILAEDLVPLKRMLLSPYHFQMVLETFDIYLDKQYEEGHLFGTQPTAKEILQTRPFTIGGSMCYLLYLTSEDAETYSPNDPCLIQLSTLVVYFNDIVGYFRDSDNTTTRDTSASLNLVRTSMRETGMACNDALRSSVRLLNRLCQDFLLLQGNYLPPQQRLYKRCLTNALSLYDYHLLGAQGRMNKRYGWDVLLK